MSGQSNKNLKTIVVFKTRPFLRSTRSPHKRAVWSYEETNQPMTTSLLVADVFGKPHADVLKVIRKVEDVDDDREGNFSLSVYQKETGSGTVRNYPYYELTRKGFTRLIMKFSGPKADMVQKKFNDAFYQMEEHIRNQQPNSSLYRRVSSVQFCTNRS